MNTLICVVAAIVGALLYRIRGHEAITILHRQVERGLVMLPLTLFVWVSTEDWRITLGAFIFNFPAISLGWGSYYGLGTNPKIVTDDEKIRPIVRWITPAKFGASTWQYQAIGMALRGLIITLPAGIASQSLLAGLSGLLVVVMYYIANYWIPWDVRVSKTFPIGDPIEWKLGKYYFLRGKHPSWGEILTGGYLWALFTALILTGG